jgi:hypothetical protein
MTTLNILYIYMEVYMTQITQSKSNMMSNSNDDDDDGGKSAKQMAVPLLRRRLNPAVLGIVVIAITAAFLMFSSSVPKQNGHGEDLLIYDFRSGYAEPPHLTPINVTNDIIPREDL